MTSVDESGDIKGFQAWLASRKPSRGAGEKGKDVSQGEDQFQLERVPGVGCLPNQTSPSGSVDPMSLSIPLPGGEPKGQEVVEIQPRDGRQLSRKAEQLLPRGSHQLHLHPHTVQN